MSTHDFRSTPHPEYPFWLYSPECDGVTFWRTAKERDDYAKKDIDTYLDGNEWLEEVEGICAGVCTHRVEACDVIKPVGVIDEDGCDEVGEYWPSDFVASKCNYALMPIQVENQSNPSSENV